MLRCVHSVLRLAPAVLLLAATLLPSACANKHALGPTPADLGLAAAAAGSERAGRASPASDAAGAPPVIVEREFYVPFDDIEEVFERTGRGIFLPYEKFLELWNAAERREPTVTADPPAGAVVRGGSYRGQIEGDVARFDVVYVVEALRKGWSEVKLPLSGVAVESVELSRADTLFAASGDSYSVYLPSPGPCDVRLVVSARVAATPGKKSIRFSIPPTGVSRLELSIPEDRVRVDVEPSLVVTQTVAEERATRVLAFLGNASEVTVSWMPPAGKAADGGAILFAEQWVRVELHERILKIATDIDYDVQRGEVSALRVRLPADTRLISVKGDNIRAWNPEGDLLTVELYAPIEIGKPYRLSLAFERILDATPPSIAVPFARVEDVMRESGWAVLRYEDGLNVRLRAAQGLSQLDPEEVPEVLRPSLGIGFRYLAHPLELDLSIEKILPVVRASTTSVVALGREEDQWIGWIDYAISKAGIFRLEFLIPPGWTVHTIGTPEAIEEYHTTEVAAPPRTLVQVSLKAKALGDLRLPFRLGRDGTAGAKEAELYPPEVRGEGLAQERGILGVTAPRNVEIVTAERPGMLDADADELLRSGILGQIPSDASLPRAYQYRKHPASLKLRLEEKKTEIEVLAQHLVEVGDGEIRVTHLLDYSVLYAPVERLRFRAPSALDETLKVDAKHKTQARIAGSEGGVTTWEVSLQPPLLGAVTLTLSHVIDLKGLETGRPSSIAVPLVRPAGVRSEQGFVAVRKDATLEITPATTGMEVLDASDLPDKLRRGQIYTAFRYLGGTPELSLGLTRFEYEQLATTVVQLLYMVSTLSEERQLRTQAVLFVQNTERQYLELKLAPEARILTLSVAGERQSPRKRKEGAGTLVQIPRSAGAGGTFPVQITYEEPIAGSAMGSFGRATVQSLQVLDRVPVSKVELALYVPPEYVYLGWSGNLTLREHPSPGLWTRFKALLTPATGAAAGGTGYLSATPVAMPEGIVIDVPTEGYHLYRFDTLAPAGEVRFFYAGNRLYWLADFLAFIAALLGTRLVMTRFARSERDAAIVILVATAALTWFLRGPALGFATSVFLGAAAMAAWRGLVHVRGRWQARRATRLALAPDPFIEEAPAKPPEPPPAPPPAPPAAGEGRP